VAGYPVEWHRRMAAQYRRSRASLQGDYYPLTGCSVSPKDWLAYQMHRDDLGEGIVVAFRRPESPLVSAEFRLQGLDPNADYEVENADTGEVRRSSGQSLAQKGVTVTMNAAPESCLLFYKKLH
jgi:alpha-galactosidase